MEGIALPKRDFPCQTPAEVRASLPEGDLVRNPNPSPNPDPNPNPNPNDSHPAVPLSLLLPSVCRLDMHRSRDPVFRRRRRPRHGRRQSGQGAADVCVT